VKAFGSKKPNGKGRKCLGEWHINGTDVETGVRNETNAPIIVSWDVNECIVFRECYTVSSSSFQSKVVVVR
jgi:hypothetical protein